MGEDASNIMALPKPATDRPRQLPKSRFWPRLLSFVSVGSLTLAPVAALTLWLLISDPVTAAAVMERGDLLPVLGALAKVVGKAIAAMLAML
jgi:hypothetical protein